MLRAEENLGADHIEDLHLQQVFLWQFRCAVANSGEVIAKGTPFFDQEMAGYEDGESPTVGEEGGPIVGRLPPLHVRGSRLAKWRRDQVSDGQNDYGTSEDTCTGLIRSALWLLQRSVRNEPVLMVGSEWNTFSRAESWDLARYLRHVSAEDYAPAGTDWGSFGRLELTTDESATRNFRSKQNQDWPDIEFDAIIQKDGFLANREYYGRWRKINRQKPSDDGNNGPALIDSKGTVTLVNFPGAIRKLYTNLMARNLLTQTKCCVWQSDWRTWHGFSLRIEDHFKIGEAL